MKTQYTLKLTGAALLLAGAMVLGGCKPAGTPPPSVDSASSDQPVVAAPAPTNPPPASTNTPPVETNAPTPQQPQP